MPFKIFWQGCHRSGNPEKPGKIREIEIGHGNRKKSGENIKNIWNFEICSQFPETAPISNYMF